MGLKRIRPQLIVVVATLTLVTGCSWVFQKRLPGGLSNYDGDQVPNCSTSRALMVLDILFAAGGAADIAYGASSGSLTSEQQTYLILGGVLDVLTFGASAISGNHWAGECKEAHAIWGNRGDTTLSETDAAKRARLAQHFTTNPTNDPDKATAFWCGQGGRCTGDESTCPGTCQRYESAWCAPAERGFVCARDKTVCTDDSKKTGVNATGECVERRAAKWDGPQTATISPTPSGHFCASSASQPTASFCARDQKGCETARDAAGAAISDLAACTQVESAHCFDASGRERCFPTTETCTARAAGAACTERK